MEKFNHIEIIRESTEREYRFKSNPAAPKPPTRNNIDYGQYLKNRLTTAVNETREERIKAGIQSDKLIVLEIMGNAISPKTQDKMLSTFNMTLVEETSINKTNNTQLLVQFEDFKHLELFEEERKLWECGFGNSEFLTSRQRDEIFSSIDNIRKLDREDRLGNKLREFLLKNENSFEGFIIVNIDIWFNGNRRQIFEVEKQIKTALGDSGSQLLGDLFLTSSLLLGRVKVNCFTLNSLLNLDIVSYVDLPLSMLSPESQPILNYSMIPTMNDNLDEKSPVACVLDSGIQAGHPLFKGLVIAEEDFDNTEDTVSDLNGHGTNVAGIIAYGDFYEGLKTNIFKPLVRLCSAKILHNSSVLGQKEAKLSGEKREEVVIKEAIQYFFEHYNCRVFNLSVGDPDQLYLGGRQFAWAEVLDQVSRELDVVIVVSAGNVGNPELSDFDTREELLNHCRDMLFDEKHRLINPATAALAITVGSISRSDTPSINMNQIDALAATEKDCASVFTRVGKGVNQAIKPELVDYGGNYSVYQQIRGKSTWNIKDKNLQEITLSKENNQIFTGVCGTSFAAPHVTHYAARIEHALNLQMVKAPSANLIRAMLVNCARCTENMISWAESSKDIHYEGKDNPKQERRLRLLGYGKIDETNLYSNNKSVTLFSEDSLNLRQFHLYKIPVPRDFLSIKANKSISISMAYNPCTRLGRKEYLANNLWFEVFRRVDEKTLEQLRDKNSEDVISKIPDKFKAKFSPGYQEISKGTLQQRIWKKGPIGGSDLLWEDNDPYIYVLVTGKERFKHIEQDLPQDYALVITFSYGGDDEINLYNQLKERVKIKTRQTIRTPAAVKI